MRHILFMLLCGSAMADIQITTTDGRTVNVTGDLSDLKVVPNASPSLSPSPSASSAPNLSQTTPPTAQPTLSPDGTSIPSASQIVDRSGHVWTVQGGVISIDGQLAGYSANVTKLLYFSGAIYQSNGSGWWKWNGSGWDDSQDPTQPAPSASVAYFTTQGSQILDGSGNPVRLACVGYMGSDVNNDVNYIKQAGFNCVRIAWNNATMANDVKTIDALVAASGNVGLKVILDHHGNETPGNNNGWLPYPCNGLPFDSGPGTDGTDGCGDPGTVTRQKFIDDWATMAERYAGNPTVIGAGLQNEPHHTPSSWGPITGASWGDGSATDIRQIYSDAGAAIHAVNPGLLIICSGPFAQTKQLYNGTDAESSPSDLSLAGQKPVVTPVANKVVYEIHDYPRTIGGQSYSDGDPADIDRTNAWGYLVAQNIAPVWVGEMGASLDNVGPDSKDANLQISQAWANQLVKYLNGQSTVAGAPKSKIGTDWWAFLTTQQPNESPDGIMMPDGKTYNPQQQAIYSQLQN